MPVLPVSRGRTIVMGVLNVTPDSFADGGQFRATEEALVQARRLIAEGADILDIGAESTRPGSDPVPEQEELDRAAPVVTTIANEFAVPISIDTYKPAVAEECLKLGATIVNDVTGLRDAAMMKTIKRHGAAAIIMHMRGMPKTMQQDVDYDDVVSDVRTFLAERIAAARSKGIEEIVIDPGIGFSKTASQNFQLLRRLQEFQGLQMPVLIGPSRKSFLGSLASRLPVEDRLEGTIAACCVGALNGAAIVRVHDVRAVKRALEVVDAIRFAKAD
ncbi:MAG: dihydropteroate synthase [Acidobacteria bacterium]|nr:dihydropteroate synthase [Acidobacteriota bacterium]MDA1234998.1 dihydropteroate synthase [Acidobacteriota bacterium]